MSLEQINQKLITNTNTNYNKIIHLSGKVLVI